MHWFIATFLLFGASAVPAAEVIQVTWKTQHAAPPPQLAKAAADLLPAFRLALAAMPESASVALALSQPALLGISPAEAATLRPRVAARYELIAKSPVYAKVPSALPHCFAEKQPQHGLALVHVPDGMNDETPVLVFLHGYGGSFLWYQHLLAEHFPGHVILCPVHGITTAAISPEYVRECLEAVSTRLRRPINKPALVGLSAGGTGACHLYTRHPKRFDRMICLASYPAADLIPSFPRQGRAMFMAGGEEPFVTAGDFVRRVSQVRQRAPATQAWIVASAGHFFLLTHTAETVERLRLWLE